MTPTLWGRPNAHNVMKVDCTLQALGIDYTRVDIGSQPGDLDTPDFRALNPLGRIPVLQIDGLVLRESHTICRYLAARSGTDPAWWPADNAAQAAINTWLDWELASWEPAFMALFWGFYRCPPERHRLEAIEDAAERCRVCVAELDRALAVETWLTGPAPSLADLCCSVGLHRYRHMGYPVTLPDHVTRWTTQLAALPAWRATAMACFEGLRGRESY
ncbi:MAG: glutathione S-transferase family protein [Pseudomonadota bacterium]